MQNLQIVILANQPKNKDPCHKKFMNERNKKKYVAMWGRGDLDPKKNVEKTNGDRVTGWMRKWGTRREKTRFGM